MAQSYAFASMRIRMMERQILSESVWKRLLTSRDLLEALAILRESRYGALLEGQGQEGKDFDQILQEELARQADQVQDLIEDAPVRAFLFHAYDLHNLKMLIKSELAEGPEEAEAFAALCYPFGSLFLPQIKDWIHHPQANPKRTDLEQALAEGVAIWTESQDARRLDLCLDRWLFRQLQSWSQAIDRPFFSRYVQKMADATNILNFFRASRRKESRNFLSNLLVEGGRIARADFEKIYGLEGVHYTLFFQKAELGHDFEEAVRSYVQDGRITTLEQAKDRLKRALSAEALRGNEGPELLFGYFSRVESEIQNLRILLHAKQVGLEEAEIKERMRTDV